MSDPIKVIVPEKNAAQYASMHFAPAVEQDGFVFVSGCVGQADEAEEEFFADWPRTEGRRVEKTRYKVKEGDLTWEVDAFDHWDLVMAEVELPTAEELVGVPPVLETSEDLVGEAEEGEGALAGIEVGDDEVERNKMLDQIAELIQAEPQKAANLLGRWMAAGE